MPRKLPRRNLKIINIFGVEGFFFPAVCANQRIFARVDFVLLLFIFVYVNLLFPIIVQCFLVNSHLLPSKCIRHVLIAEQVLSATGWFRYLTTAAHPGHEGGGVAGNEDAEGERLPWN